jgi:hypothetical protein
MTREIETASLFSGSEASGSTVLQNEAESRGGLCKELRLTAVKLFHKFQCSSATTCQ